jgi:hypothetical protein
MEKGVTYVNERINWALSKVGSTVPSERLKLFFLNRGMAPTVASTFGRPRALLTMARKTRLVTSILICNVAGK